MSYDEISRDLEKYVIELFRSNPDERLLYHNLDHTLEVVKRADEIASAYSIDQESMFILKAAAWFHDTGYLFKGPTDHERESVRLMAAFFLRYEQGLALVEKILQTIMMTKKPSDPHWLREKILCDADTYHFGTDDFKRTDPLVKKEIALFVGAEPENWVARTITMLKNHRFYTSYCIDRLEKGKMRNIAWLESLRSGGSESVTKFDY